MKKIIILLIFLLPLVSCGGDEGIDDPQTQTFLEKYEGTVWKAEVDTNNHFYLKFNNSSTKPISQTRKNWGMGYYTIPVYTGYNFIANNFNNLVLEVPFLAAEPSSLETEYLTFTVKNDILIATYESGTTYTLNKSSLQFSDLKMCVN